MTNVVIIDVDLGAIDKLIYDDVAELSGDSKRVLDEAIKQRKRVEDLHQKKTEEKQRAITATDRAMQDAYDKLESAGEKGVPCDDIADLVAPHVPTLSAFTLRMKKLLRDGENKYVIKRKKINKVPHYYFQIFNGEADGTSPERSN